MTARFGQGLGFSRGRVAGLALLLAVIVLAAVGGAAAHNGISLTGSGTPVIDGVISPGEWDAAGSVSFMATVAGGPSVPGTLRVMNDGTNLYLGVSVEQPVLGSTAFRFDNNHNGSGVEQGDDNLAIGFGVSPAGANKLADGTYSRLPPCPAGFTCGFRDTDIGGTTDGFGAFHVSSDKVDYELSHPLDSGDDAHDFSLHAGSVVGVLFQVATRNAAGTSSITQPFGSTVLSDIVIQPPDTTPPTISCGSPDGLWHSADVSIECSASDAASGLENASDASFSLSTHVADGTQTASAATDSRTVCDKAGNCSTAGPIDGNKVDKKAPEAFAVFDPGTDDLLVYATDSGGSGVPAGPVTPASAGKGERGYEIVDGVGNSLSLILFVDTANSTIDARIESLSYNHDPVIDAPDNHIGDAFHGEKDGSLRALTQEASVGKGQGAVHVTAAYDAKQDQTTIDVAGGGGSTRPGLVLLRLQTDQGALAVDYS